MNLYMTRKSILDRMAKTLSRGLKKKLNQRRNNKRRKAQTLTVRGPTVASDQLFVKMRYTKLFSLNSATGIMAQQVFRGNSLFDPEEPIGGGQPMGRDQYAALYQSYQVMGSKIKIEFSPRESADGIGTVFGTVPIDIATSVTGIAQAIELPYSKHMSAPNGQSKAIVINNYISTKSKFGYKDILQSDKLSSLQGSSPSEQFYWTVYGIAVDGLGTVVIDCVATITYYVRLFDRKDLSRS